MKSITEYLKVSVHAVYGELLVTFQRGVTCISTSQGDWTCFVGSYPNLETTAAVLAKTRPKGIWGMMSARLYVGKWNHTIKCSTKYAQQAVEHFDLAKISIFEAIVFIVSLEYQ